MKKEIISHALGEIDARYVAEAAEYAPPTARFARVRRAAAAAACLVLLAGIGFGAFAVAAEAGEYRAAVDFFEENGLSTEGLSRAELKAVYRDITTERFASEKTAEVLRRSVPGWEISQEEATPETLAALWEQNFLRERTDARGISYRREYSYTRDESLGFDTLEKSILTCRRGGETLWTAEFRDFYVEGCAAMSAGTAVWGFTPTWSSAQPVHAWLALVAEDGAVRWQRRLEHGFQRESVGAVLDDGDGTWAVLSRGDGKFLCLSRLDAEGNELHTRRNEVGNLGIWNAVRLGDGYLVQLGNTTSHDTALLLRLDRDGAAQERITYEAEDCAYHITGMASFGGAVYLSAYAVPIGTDEGGRHEIAGILDMIFAQGSLEPPPETVTAAVQQNYTAVLLVCDAAGGAPRTFYSVPGSLGGALEEDVAGGLVWEVERVDTVRFSPHTSAYSLYGSCRVFRYTFDAAGTLVSQQDSGETSMYAR